MTLFRVIASIALTLALLFVLGTTNGVRHALDTFVETADAPAAHPVKPHAATAPAPAGPADDATMQTGLATRADAPQPAALPIALVAPIETADRYEGIATEIEAIWRAWMVENEVAEGAMALALPDGRVISSGQGRAPDVPAPVASLSKAITGLCLNDLLTERQLGWTTRLGDIATEMSDAGVTPRPWNEHLTLDALVTHTAGLAPDLTQGDLMGRTHGALGLHRRVAADALAEGAIRGTPGQYFYSNTNYAVLAVAIEALSGTSYAETCMQRVITPAGLEDAVIHGRMGSMSSYAGWEISAEDYARLARHWFSAGQDHIDAPAGRPNAGGYAMGYQIEGTGRGAAVTHNGRLCQDRETRDGHGATFVAMGEGLAFAANWGNCIAMERYTQLQSRIAPLMR